jgi:hypothetical protein
LKVPDQQLISQRFNSCVRTNRRTGGIAMTTLDHITQKYNLPVAQKRAALYIRVSTKKQEDGYSREFQREQGLRHCQEQGYLLDTEKHIFEETHTGIEYRERPILSAMRQAAYHHEFDVLVYVLQVDEVGAVGLEEAAPGKASFEFFQGEVGRGFLGSSTQVGLTVAAHGVKDVARVVEQNMIIFACRHFVGSQTLRRRRAFLLRCVPVAAGNATIFQFYHVGAKLARPDQVFVRYQATPS